MDDTHSPPTAPQPACCTVRSASFKLAALLVAGAAVVAASGFLMIHFRRPPADPGKNRAANPDEAEQLKAGTLLFHHWPKPEVALVLSAQQYGYLLPCGCSRPQKGGLERRYNFIQSLQERGWPVVAVDLGDIPQRYAPQKLPNIQGLLKYEYSMRALKEMGYSAVNFGETEMAMPLEKALGQYALNNPVPRVLADNLKDAADKFPETGRWMVVQPEGSPLKVGIAGVVGPTVRGKVSDPSIRFLEVKDVLPKVLKDMEKEKPALRVLLYQGMPKEAKACAEAFPQFQVVLSLSEPGDEEPPNEPQRVGPSLVIVVGHKGRYVGVVGANRRPDRSFDLRYQLVPMSEQFVTPREKEKNHPILALLEKYTEELKRDGYLQKYGQTRHPVQVQFPQATYVGSEACQKCHEAAYQVWKNSRHAHAYQTLVDARNPSLRQYDAECVVCHVTGFAHQGGFRSEEQTPTLKNVGCESCHGPASLHVGDPKNLAFRAALNPWKAQPGEDETRRIGRIDQACQKCHDPDNDVHWSFDKWKAIAH
jgi:hypothetical protein